MGIVVNYIATSRKKRNYVIHSELPFKDFMILLDVLFDANYVDVKEISEEDYNTLYMTSDVSAFKIDKDTFESILDRLNKK